MKRRGNHLPLDEEFAIKHKILRDLVGAAKSLGDAGRLVADEADRIKSTFEKIRKDKEKRPQSRGEVLTASVPRHRIPGLVSPPDCD